MGAKINQKKITTLFWSGTKFFLLCQSFLYQTYKTNPMKIILTIVFIALCNYGMSQKYLAGYAKTIKGQEFEYHAPQPDAKKSLLVRSEQSANYIEWETEIMPEKTAEKTVRFLLLYGIDVNPESLRKWDISINGEKYFTIESPKDTLQKRISYKNEDFVLEFNASEVDKHGDFMGYMILTVPKKLFPAGKPLTIRATSEDAGKQTWFMVFRYKAKPYIKLASEPAIINSKSGESQVLRVSIVEYDNTEDAVLFIGEKVFKRKLKFGYNVIYVDVPRITKTEDINVKINIDGKLITDKQFTIKPIGEKKIYLIHHSHVDIGYTHLQSEVEKLQWSYIESAIELSKKSQTLAEEAHFKWNVEVMWAVDSYLKQANAQKRQELINAVKNGWIDLNILYANELTALCSSRELIELTEAGRRIAKECGIVAETAMISDIPGWTWGLVPVLKHSGVKYLSLGTNQFHRIGNIIDEYGDKPFYWEAQSGEKVLTWIHQAGYSHFHTGLGAKNLRNVLSEDKIFAYLNDVQENNVPYNILLLRYNIGSDNGPTDKSLSETVRRWNEKYISPKLIISTATEAFKAFEKEYGKNLPTHSGDITAYWEDGAISSARETALNRDSKTNITNAEIFSSLYSTDFNRRTANDIWQQILLFDEHTWGSWNSISEPESDFTKQQWEVKKAFAERGNKNALALLNNVLKNRLSNDDLVKAIEVINTESWARTDLVEFASPKKINGERLLDAEGNTVDFQKLNNGNIVFVAENVPALGSKIFYFDKKKRKTKVNNKLEIAGNVINNSNITIEIAPETGSIKRLTLNDFNVENFVNNSNVNGLNSYFYVKGRHPKNQSGTSNVKISTKENGNVLSSIIVESDAAGCEKISREIILYNNLDRIDIVNTLDKKKVYEQEGVHIGFPFNIPKGKIRYDLAFSAPKVEEHQLSGSNKNYYTVENWVDISNNDFGVTWATKDAPLIEIGNITSDPIAYGWVREVKPTQTFYSYLMNNYWETNYCAAQEGEMTFKYSLKFHKNDFNQQEAEKFGRSTANKLIAIQVDSDTKKLTSPVLPTDNGIIVIGMRPVGKGILFIMYNSTEETKNIEWDKLEGTVYESNFDGDKLDKVNKKLDVKSNGIKCLYVELKNITQEERKP